MHQCEETSLLSLIHYIKIWNAMGSGLNFNWNWRTEGFAINKAFRIPPTVLNHLKRRIKTIDTKYPWSVNPNVILFLLMGHYLSFFVWHLRKIKSHIKGFKPIIQLLFGKDKTFTKQDKMVKLIYALQTLIYHTQPIPYDIWIVLQQQQTQYAALRWLILLRN